jgi:hypothetical protein
MPWPPSEPFVVLRTCVPPVSVPLGVHLRHALYCAVAALPYVMRGLREEGIASRRRIRVARGRMGHVERVLALLALLRLLLWLLLWLWLWLCRRGIARKRVGGRRLVVWVVDQMAIWRARKRRGGLAGVHGVVCQLCSIYHKQSSRANLGSQTAHAMRNAGSESGLQLQLHGKATGTGTGTGTSKHGFVAM